MKSFLEHCSSLNEAVQTLTTADLYRFDRVVNQFVNDYKNGVPFKLVSGEEVILKYKPAIKRAIIDRESPGSIEFMGVDGNKYKLKDLEKTKKYSGGSGSSTGSANTKITESAQAVYAKAKWNGSIDYTESDIIEAFNQVEELDVSLEDVQGISDKWRNSCILGAEELHQTFGKKNYTFHHKSEWVLALELLFKKLNKPEKRFYNINKWSPADIYMISKKGLSISFDDVVDIVELNNLLHKALESKDIIGVSLKFLKKEPTISYYNIGEDRPIIEFDRFTTGAKDFFSSKDIYMFFTHNGKIQFRTFPNVFQGEITGINSNEGKLGYGPVQNILRLLKMDSLVSISDLRQDLYNEEESVYSDFYKNYTKYSTDTKKISYTKFKTYCEENPDWCFSKILGCQLIDIISTNQSENDFLTMCVQYASSTDDLSAPFIRLA